MTDESQRLQAVYEAELLDTLPESDFDELVLLASRICGTPISLVSIVDKDRQWFKAALGLDCRETSREVSFCAHAIQQSELFVVEDATRDSRFAKNPLVTGDPSIRFYAGMPLAVPEGPAIGTLCVIDRVPRTLTEEQRSSLAILAKLVMSKIAMRMQQRRIEAALSERDRALLELRAGEERFHAFMRHSPHVIFLKSEDGRYIFYNPAFAELFGVDQSAWIGRLAHEVLPKEVAQAFRADDQAVLQCSGALERLVKMVDAKGRLRCIRMLRFTYRRANDERMLAGIAVDVTESVAQRAELEEANRQLRDLATTDSLTGLFNRRVLSERLEAEFAAARRYGRKLSLLMIDIDNFKARNDRWGHPAGDAVLRKLGHILSSKLRRQDTAARYGGEEFAMILPETGEQGAEELAERLRAYIAAEPWEHEEVTISVGVASMDAETADHTELLRRADGALYAAKHAGKNRVLLAADLRIQSTAAEVGSLPLASL